MPEIRLDARPSVAPVARHAIALLRDALREPPPDGAVWPLYGWPLTLRRERDAVRVCGPAGFCEPVEDLTTVLGLIALQLGTARRSGVEPAGFDPEDDVLIADGAVFEAPRVMLARDPAPPPGLSGWHVRAQPEDEAALAGPAPSWVRVSTLEILRRRNSLLVPMALPAGLIVRMDGDDVVRVTERSGVERWR